MDDVYLKKTYRYKQETEWNNQKKKNNNNNNKGWDKIVKESEQQKK